MKNSELLNYPGSFLGGLEKQRQFVLRSLIQKAPCPNCATKQSFFEAAGIEVDDFQSGQTLDSQCKCVRCGRELLYTIPLIKLTEPGWLWTLVPIKLDEQSLPVFYECGVCGHCHPWTWHGDCRDDANRFTNQELEEKYGTDFVLRSMEERVEADTKERVEADRSKPE